MSNVIKDKVKANLTSTEKLRYMMAAEHFMRGSSDFYVEHYRKLGKLIDFEAIRDKMEREYHEFFDDFKSKMSEKVEQFKQNAKFGISRFIDKVLDVSLVLSSYFALMPDKLRTVVVNGIRYSFGKLWESTDYLFNYDQYLKKYFGKDFDIWNETKKILSKIIDFFDTAAYQLYQGIDYFLTNDDFFKHLFNLTAAAAFNRSFDSSFGFIFGLFFEKIDLSAKSKPDLYNYCKFGSKTYRDISAIEDDFNRIIQQSGKDAGWVLNRKVWKRDAKDISSGITPGSIYHSNSGRIVDEQHTLDELEEFANKTKFVHDLYFGAVEQLSKESSNTNRFAYKNPYESMDFKKAQEESLNLINSALDADNFVEIIGKAQYGRNFYYKGTGLNATISALDNFEKKFARSTNPVVKESITRWRQIKKNRDSDSRKKLNLPSYIIPINIAEAQEMMYLRVVFVTIEREEEMERMIDLETEASNFMESSLMKEQLRFLKKLRDGVEIKSDFSQMDGLKSAKKLFEEKIVKRTDFFNALKKDDMFDENVSVYKVVNKILSIRNELMGIRYARMGVKRDNVFFFNNYSTNSDSVMGTMQFQDSENEGQYVFRRVNGAISNNMTSVEISKRIVEEFVNVKKKEVELRRERDYLVSEISKGVANLVNLYPKNRK